MAGGTVEGGNMKKRVVALLMAALMGTFCMTGCGNSKETTVGSSEEAGSEAGEEKTQTETEETANIETETDANQKAADEVAALIDAIYVQKRTDETDKQCADAKAAWDALTDAQKELVEGENADPDYFGRDTGDASKDDPRNQDEIGENSSKKVWWMSSEGHEWQAIIYSRTIGNRCHYCNNKKIMKGYNDFSTTHPYLVKEWDYNKNSQLSPSEIFSGYNKKVWWICPKGHSYQQTPNNRISGHGCPICSKEKVTSFQEKIVYYYIKKYFPDATDNYKLKD